VTYDEKLRETLTKALLDGADEAWRPMAEDAARTVADTIPNSTLKIDGRFVRVEIASGTNYTSKTHYTPLYRIVDDSDA
jgi:hypothetical protein